jgi:enoyl-CoA hydratase/carnithine racemase
MQDTQSPVTVERESPACWRVTFDNPPLNLYDPEFVRGLSETVATIEADPEVTVVVFQSAVPGYFMNHLDLLRTGDIDRTVSPQSGLSPWPDLATRIAHLPCDVGVAPSRGASRRRASRRPEGCDRSSSLGRMFRRYLNDPGPGMQQSPTGVRCWR